jgi:hypothetical protein
MSYSLKTNSVVLTKIQKRFLKKLAKKLNFDFVVTSGYRTPHQQTLAMFRKIELGEDLRFLYNDAFADQITNAYPNQELATEIITEYAKQGGGSSHLRGLAVDIRNSNLTIEQQQEIVDTVAVLGSKAIIETTPPHIHITIQELPVKSVNWFWYVGIGIISIPLMLFLLKKKKMI